MIAVLASEAREGVVTTPHDVARLAGSSAALLLLRRVLITVVAALSTAIIARWLGIARFGELASARGLLELLQTVADFGFSLVVARELARSARGRALLGAAVLTEGIFGVALMAVMAVIGLALGIGSERGTVILILAPSLGISALVPMRQVFLVSYRVKDLAKIDVSTNVTLSLLLIAVAFSGAGLFAVAALLTGGQVLNSVLVARAARRRIPPDVPTRADLGRMLRDSLPLGLASIIATVYFTVDLVILPWLVSGHAVGEYAAAVKFLTLLATVPVLVMTAVLPGMSSLRDRAHLAELAARVSQWLAVFALPMCVGAVVFAPTMITIFFGSAYHGSAPLLRVLAFAAALTLVSNVLGTLLTSQAVVRPLLVQSAVAMVVNVGGNLALVPRYGPIASAWLTVVTELIVVCGSLLALRGRVSLRPALAAAARPGLACGVLAAVGLALGRWPTVAVPAAIVAYFTTVLLLRAWPVELQPRWFGRFGTQEIVSD